MNRIIPPYLKQDSEPLTDYPEISKFWSDLNDYPIDKVSSRSQRKFIWNCTQGENHTFSRVVAKMFKTSVCPICTFRELLKGFNDIETTHPEISKRWSLNNQLKVTEVMQSNTKKFYWIDELGHEYKYSVYDVVFLKKNCPYCAGQRILPGFNDLPTTAPEEIEFWNFGKNSHMNPQEISKGSNKKVWWKCSLDHEDFCSPKDWIYRHCRVCSGRQLLLGFNDVFTKAPHLKEEWNYEKNTLDPLTLRFNYRDKVWWKCSKCSHEWESALRGRIQKGIGCPSCAIQTSFLEEIVDNFLKSNYDGIVLRQRRPIAGPNGRNLELDFWLPEINLGIEVQDFTTHSKDSDTEYTDYRAYDNLENYKKGPTYHKLKRDLAKEQLGVTLVELWEDTIRLGDEAIFEVLKNHLSTDTAVVTNDGISRMVETRKEAYKRLDRTVNDLTFEEFNSKKKRDILSWVCDFGHQYKTEMFRQVSNNVPCTVCSIFEQVVLGVCSSHGEVQFRNGRCLSCNSEKRFEMLECEIHGEAKHKNGKCYSCVLSKATVLKVCPVHGESKHRGDNCYKCSNNKSKSSQKTLF